MTRLAAAHDGAKSAFALRRPFGEDAADLELDFAAAPRAELVTAVLGNCLRELSTPDETWEWSLHRRLQALIAVERASGTHSAALHARCPDDGCGEPMELDLDLAQFVLPDQPERFECDVAPGVRLAVRLPTGADQRRWRSDALTGADPQPGLARELVLTVNGAPLADDAAFAVEWIEPLADALAARDPLTALRLVTRCPACGRSGAIAFDLEAHLLSSAAARQAQLLDTVHRLARAYHWSEREILALPRGRREHYLARVRAEEVQ